MTYPQYAPPAQPQQQPAYPAYPQTQGAAPQYTPAPAPSYPQPPQTYGAATPQYAPQPQPVYTPAQPIPAGQGIAPPVPTLRDGGGGGGQASPKMRHLLGRTIVVVPKGINEAAKNTETNEIKPEAHFDLIVVDGGPVQYGDNQSKDFSKRRPNTFEADTPHLFRDCRDMGEGFVQAVRGALDSGEHGKLGVVEQGSRGNRPYLLARTGVTLDGVDRPDGQARFETAMHQFGLYWDAKHGGAPYQQSEPRSLIPTGPQPGAPAVNYGYGQTPAAQYGAPAPTYPAYTPPLAQPAAAPALPPVPPEVEQWLSSLDPAQRDGARAQYLAQQQGAPAAAGGPGL